MARFGPGPAGAGWRQHSTPPRSRGYLAFESEGGGEDLVAADQFAVAVSQGQVPLVVLNACRSGMLGEAAVEAAVATRLLEGGAASVVAMGYSVYAVAAAEFMAAFYEALFAGQTVSAAVAAGRQRLFRQPERPSPKGMLPLADWIVPVHYLRQAIELSALRRPRASGCLAGCAARSAAPQSRAAGPGGCAGAGSAVHRPGCGFYTLELALRRQRVVVVHGPAGTGKTELAKAFGRWWRLTGGVERADWVFFHAFEPGLASFGLDGVINEIGLQLFGPDFVGKTRDAAQRVELLLQVLRERRMLLIWDNFESVCEPARPERGDAAAGCGGTAPDAGLPGRLAREGGQSTVLITSRTEEAWLGEVRRVELGGLTPAEAAEMAEDVLQPYAVGRQRRQEREFAELLEWLDGHPLSLRLLLPHLEQVSAGRLLAGLRGSTAQLPPGFVGEGRTRSLGASLPIRLTIWPRAARAGSRRSRCSRGWSTRTCWRLFSAAEGVPARFAGIDKPAWAALLERLVAVGLLSALGGGMYRLHPALPAWLAADWRGRGRRRIRRRARRRRAGAAARLCRFGTLADQQFSSGGGAGMVLAVIERQRHTMGRLLGQALAGGHYAAGAGAAAAARSSSGMRAGCGSRRMAGSSASAPRSRRRTAPRPSSTARLALCGCSLPARRPTAPSRRGISMPRTPPMTRSASAWKPRPHEAARPRARSGLSPARHGGAAPGRSGRGRGLVPQVRSRSRRRSATGPAWPRATTSSAWWRRSGAIWTRPRTGTANRWRSRKRSATGPGMATSYHQLGIVAQDRGDLDAAEDWYRKSLAIKEALGDRPGMATSYHQLGMVAQERGDLDAAEDWYRKSLAIKEALGNRPGHGHELPPARHRGAGARRSRCGRGLVPQVPGDRGGARQPAGHGDQLRPTRLAGPARRILSWLSTGPCAALRCFASLLVTGPAPQHLVRLTAALPLPVLEASWERCTGEPSPEQVRAEVVRRLASR